MKDRIVIPLALPLALARRIDRLVKEGEFSSRNDALKFGARLVVMTRGLHQKAEDYAYEEIKQGLERGKL